MIENRMHTRNVNTTNSGVVQRSLHPFRAQVSTQEKYLGGSPLDVPLHREGVLEIHGQVCELASKTANTLGPHLDDSLVIDQYYIHVHHLLGYACKPWRWNQSGPSQRAPPSP